PAMHHAMSYGCYPQITDGAHPRHCLCCVIRDGGSRALKCLFIKQRKLSIGRTSIAGKDNAHGNFLRAYKSANAEETTRFIALPAREVRMIGTFAPRTIPAPC